MILLVQHKLLLLFSIFMICAFTLQFSMSDEARKQGVVFQVFCGAFCLVAFTIFYALFMLVFHLIFILAGKHVGVLGAHTLEIKDDGLEESTAVNKSLHRWNPQFKVREFGNYVLIYPTDDKYFQIPKRNGGHKGDLATFLAHLKTKITSNKSPTAPPEIPPAARAGS